ncbi:RES family NAD+ phosphorylase [Duganella levis]|uniref:RES family NAD+ phosphorylase n=1 Tax=Duganella levis TaxID=2692169 RepID=UPI001E4149EB|nr:RES family NAD+ phosphorylase [Duganella levis]
MAKALPYRTIQLAAGSWYRVHQFDAVSGAYGPTTFNDSGLGNARFSPLRDPATGNVIPTMYAVSQVRGALAEILLRDVPEPSAGFLYDWERDRASDLHLSAIRLPPLRVVNLTSTGLRAAGLHDAGLFAFAASSYPATRARALAVWEGIPDVQGLCWMSVRDNQSMAVMLFGDRLDPALLSVETGPAPIAAYQASVFALLDELGCGLAL